MDSNGDVLVVQPCLGEVCVPRICFSWPCRIIMKKLCCINTYKEVVSSIIVKLLAMTVFREWAKFGRSVRLRFHSLLVKNGKDLGQISFLI